MGKKDTSKGVRASKAVVRVVAESVGGTADDVAWRMVLDAVLEGSVVRKQMHFGFISNNEDGPSHRWPFILRPESGKWMLDYGADVSDSIQPTNIVDREIRIGNYFTIWDGDDEITMRITQINEH